jgi:O-antigen ligase
MIVFALAAALTMAPVAPAAANILFLFAAGASLLFMRVADLELVRRPAIWMPLAGLAILAAAYGIGTGSPQGVLGIFYFAPFLATWPLLSLFRSADAPKLWQLGAMALAGAAGAAAVAVGEFLSSGTSRAGATVANPIHFADLALSVGFLALIGSVYTKGAGRWIYLLAPAAAIVAILLSGTRGAVIALLVMVGISTITAMAMRLVSAQHLIMSLVAAVISLSGAWLAGAGQTSGVQRVTSDIMDVLSKGLPTDSSTALRLQMYEGAWRAFLAAPVFGHGPYGYVEAAASRASVPFEGAPHLHNDLANLAASGGVFGVAAYFLFLLAPLVEALHCPPSSTRAGLVVVTSGLVAGYFIMGMTNAMFGIINLTVFFSAATLVIASGARNVEELGAAKLFP